MSGGGDSQQVVKNEPPAYAQPYHKSLLENAGQLAARPYQPYGGARIAGFADDQLIGQQMVRNAAANNQPMNQAATEDLTKTLSGGYLNPATNPALQGAMDYGQRQVMKNYGAQLGSNFGNSGVNQEVGEGMGHVSAGLYDAERNRMMNAQQLRPGAASANYIDSQAMNLNGAAVQNMQQQVNDLGYNEFQNALNHPYRGLETLGSALNLTGGYGSQTGPNPYQSNPMAGAIGGAGAGYAIGSGLSAGSGALAGTAAGPWGAVIGAGLGYALS